MAKNYKLRYINNIMLFLSSKREGFRPPETPFLGAPLAQILSQDTAQ